MYDTGKQEKRKSYHGHFAVRQIHGKVQKYDFTDSLDTSNVHLDALTLFRTECSQTHLAKF